MLTPYGVVSLLLHERLIDSSVCVDGSVRVLPDARRHQHYRIIPAIGPGYFLKQGIQEEGLASVSHEGAVLRALQESAPHGAAAYLPRYCRYLPQHKVLITELFIDAISLRSYRASRARRSRSLATQLGSILAAIHQTPPVAVAALGLPYSTTHAPPWVLDLPRLTHRRFGETSRLGLQLIKLLQRFPQFTLHFDRISARWRATALIHFDIRWDNFLVIAAPPPGRAVRLKLIDWEFAGIGDPCWDVAGVLHEYLLLWIAPISSEVPLDQPAALRADKHSTADLRPAVHRFWRTYVTRMGMDRRAADAALIRATEYAAVRTVQTAYELSQSSDQMTALLPYLLQCALNILERPAEAASAIFGLTPEESP
jgi:aminoglycoside phosphotransferase (APT) family kinase protein